MLALEFVVDGSCAVVLNWSFLQHKGWTVVGSILDPGLSSWGHRVSSPLDVLH